MAVVRVKFEAVWEHLFRSPVDSAVLGEVPRGRLQEARPGAFGCGAEHGHVARL